MTAAAPTTPIRNKTNVIAVIGNPNAGKTTLFNRLTGLRQKVANYPGVTVEQRAGRLRGGETTLMDLPGAYGLSARSPDQEITRDILLGRIPDAPRPDAVLLVIDASNLERNLYLATQVLEFGLPTVIACNRADLAERADQHIDFRKLSAALGCPVVATVARTGRGIDHLHDALADLPAPRVWRRPWRLSAPVETALTGIEQAIAATPDLPAESAPGLALLWLTDYLSESPTARRAAESLLSALPPATATTLRTAAESVRAEDIRLPDRAIEARYAWITDLIAGLRHDRPADADTRRTPITDRIDQVVLHRAVGPALFAGVMFLLFLSIFSWAEPLMGLIETGQAALAGAVAGAMSEGPLRSLLTDGVIAGVGAVVVFFPQIAILFLFLSILEESGYMARAAFLMDRIMCRFGLHGHSFIPLLSSYACAIPGILATRTIEDRRDRLATILVAPLMSCSARLPVYVIVIAAVFGDRTWLKAGIMFALYVLGTATALVIARIFKKTLLAGPPPAFIMEMPRYHLPRPLTILRTTWQQSRAFLTGAGTIIFATCVIIWALTYFPHAPVADLPADVQSRLIALDDAGNAQAHDQLLASARLKHSYLGRIGHAIEPAIRPLGFDWRLGVGILSSFLAREVFVGTMGITFAVGEADESSIALRDKLAAATWPGGAPVLTPLAGVSLLVFYVLACQCVSTLAVVRKETGSWKWSALMFAYMTVLAYAGSLAIYQIGRAVGIGS